jgi:hypothetical protein
MTIPGLIVLMHATLSPAQSFGHHAERVPAFRELICVQRVLRLIELEGGQVEQFGCRRKGQADAKDKFVRDFVAAWDTVMTLDRFDHA